MSSGLNRRSFFKVIGVGTAATAAACAPRVPEKIIPHVVPPDNQIPGQSVWYASTCNECAAGCGTLIRNREGRAIKLEGNPTHPVNRGGLCARGHSALQANYHPDRYRRPLLKGVDSDWEAGLTAAAAALGRGGVAVLTGDIPAGTLADVFDGFVRATGARRIVWEPLADDSLSAASAVVFGTAMAPHFDLAAADHILSFGADFLETWGRPTGQQRGFSEARNVDAGRMAHTVVVEPRLSLTAANADEWVAARPGSEVFLAAALLRAVLDTGAAGLGGADLDQARAWIGDVDATRAAAVTGIDQARIDALAVALVKAKAPVVVAGGAANRHSNATALQVGALLLNRALGAIGKTVSLGSGAEPRASVGASGLAGLLESIRSGDIRNLLVYGVDPVFTAPAAWDVTTTLAKLESLIILDAMPNETSALASVVLPDHGPLEGWGDHLAVGGVASIRQPGMNPLWDTRHAGDTLLALQSALGTPAPHADFATALKARWQRLQTEVGATGPFEDFWQAALAAGGVFRSEAAAPAVRMGDLAKAPIAEPVRTGDGDLQLVAYPHIFRYDGRFANRPWMQEIADPMIQTSWSNWAELHPVTARRLGIGQGDRIEVKTASGAIEVYAYITSGVLPEVVAVPLGQGHESLGTFGAVKQADWPYSGDVGSEGLGLSGNPFRLLAATLDASSGAWALGGNSVKVRRVAAAERKVVSNIDLNLVTLDGSRRDLGRGIGQVIAFNEIRMLNSGEKELEPPVHHGTIIKDPNGFYPPHDHLFHQWGMVVDLNACTGCAGCVVACASENNVPMIGKQQVSVGREMSWIRIERYFEGDDAAEGVKFVPMMCQQCQNAPCEPVCPAVATYHTIEGLNGMVYNRCIGTRYCGNACVYKVRRFNYWGYDDPANPYHAWPEPMSLMLNPDVSVRSGGVMEKCTFCVQRIRAVAEPARMEGRPVADGEVLPACAQSCPSQAIVFGDLKDPESAVSRLVAGSKRGYKVLDLLNTQPAVTYLKKVRWTGENA